MKEIKLLLNPIYILKPDEKKALLLTKDPIRAKENERIESVIHPIHAMILSFCDGSEKGKCIKNAASLLKVNEDKIENFIENIFENENPVHILYEGKKIYFPVNTIINSTNVNQKYYKAYDFDYKSVDLRMGRHKTLTDITLMLTTICKTDCIYCYADRKKDKMTIPLNIIMDVIDEARSLNLRTFDIIGGDIFAYKDWETVLDKLYSVGFDTYISTKVPLTSDDVRKLKSIGVKDIQISLDTLIKDNLLKIVRVKDSYYDEIIKTLFLLEEYDIKTNIHTIICNENNSIEDIESLERIILKLRNIQLWRIDPATYSLPKGEEFDKFKSNETSLKIIYDYLSQKTYPIKVLYNSLNNARNALKKRKLEFKSNRILCTANYSHLFILPDGQVTICEQLYWNPNFIVGDITKQSLSEIWNSKEALNLYNLEQKKINPESYCSKCDVFNLCRHESGGVCWKEVIAAYGSENWDYPDPSCPHAPEIVNNIYI